MIYQRIKPDALHGMVTYTILTEQLRSPTDARSHLLSLLNQLPHECDAIMEL
jgi:hypothetical protein